MEIHVDRREVLAGCCIAAYDRCAKEIRFDATDTYQEYFVRGPDSEVRLIVNDKPGDDAAFVNAHKDVCVPAYELDENGEPVLVGLILKDDIRRKDLLRSFGWPKDDSMIENVMINESVFRQFVRDSFMGVNSHVG